LSYYFTIDKDDGKTSIFPLRKTITECREQYYKSFPDEESRKNFKEVKLFTLKREYGDRGPLRPRIHGYYNTVFTKKSEKRFDPLEFFQDNPWSKKNVQSKIS